MALTRASAAVIKTEELVNNRNRIINGDMRIDQRNAGAEVNPAVHNSYYVDRWTTFMDAENKFKIQQVTTSPPPGFTHYLRLTVTNAYTSSSTERFALNQKIEGFNVTDLDYGSVNAKPLTLSFWVRSSLTGTFGGTIHNEGGSAYKFPFIYTITSANTWEYKTISISPLTAESLTNKTTGTGIRVWFDLGSNSTATAGTWIAGNYHTGTGAQKWLSNAAATLDFTGVQLEVGSVATPFERRPFGAELALCQRYYFKLTPKNNGYFSSGYNNSTTVHRGIVNFPVSMRTEPTALEQTGTAADYGVQHGGPTVTNLNAVPSAFIASLTSSRISVSVASGLTQGQGSMLQANNDSAYLGWSAEL
jgi:hypothetical protein